MPCYTPVGAWKNARGVFFRLMPDSTHIQLPCGRCIGCRLERSRQWAARLMHELRFHDKASFITLTYDEDHLPPGGTLVPKHYQDFMKRLRKWSGEKLRFFHCGEYGEKAGRPHYHAIIFGEDFLDEVYEWGETEHGHKTWRSKDLDRIWGKGRTECGSVTFESCAYVARYITKKVTGQAAKEYYTYVDPADPFGEVHTLHPEYATMSRRPGIGKLHFDKYRDEIYPADNIVVRGVPCKPPKFYDRQLEKVNPSAYAILKDERECALTSSPQRYNRSPERLRVREKVKRASIQTLRRRFESET